MQNQSLPNQPQHSQQPEQTFLVTIKPITDVVKRKSLEEAIQRIDQTNAQLSYFFDTIYTGYQKATELLTALQAAKVIRDEQGRDRSDESVHTYLSLLQAIKAEIEKERLVLVEMLTTGEEKTIEIGEQGSENFDLFLTQKIKSAKTQTKKIESSLRISFSRYQLWIQDTIMRLTHVKHEFGLKF